MTATSGPPPVPKCRHCGRPASMRACSCPGAVAARAERQEQQAAVRARVIEILERIADDGTETVELMDGGHAEPVAELPVPVVLDADGVAALRLAAHVIASSPPPLHYWPTELEGWEPNALELLRRDRTGL